jgi:hypothetical protein
MHSAPDDHGLPERQLRLGAVPLNEIRQLHADSRAEHRGRKVVENRGLRGFEVGQSQDRLHPCAILFATAGLLHDIRHPIATG